MDTEAAFLHQIVTDPFDIATRLLYADWLDERGDPRGEFIRVQVEIAKTPKCAASKVKVRGEGDPIAWTCRWHKLWNRAEALLAVNPWTVEQHLLAVRLIDGEPAPANCRHPLARFRNGFVEQVECTSADWQEHGKAIVLAAPILEVRLTDTLNRFSEKGCLVGWPVIRSQEWRGLPKWAVFIHDADGATEELAMKHASGIVVNWARREAGLPLIDFEARRGLPHGADALRA